MIYKIVNVYMAVFLLMLMMVAGLNGCSPEAGPDQEVNEELKPLENQNDSAKEKEVNEAVSLPEIDLNNKTTVSEVLYERLSRRDYTVHSLNLAQVGDLLWAAGGLGVDGVSGATRTAPSAGGAYPLDIYLVAGNVDGLGKGVYRYDYEAHSLEAVVAEERRDQLAAAALGQQFIAKAPISIVMVAHYERTTSTYGERGERYVHMDTGYVSQNIYLKAEALDLGTVAIGAFDDEEVAEVLSTEGAPLMIMPIGVPEQ